MPFPHTPQPELPTIKPIVVQFPEFDYVADATFSIDGKSIYAVVPAKTLKLGWVVSEAGAWLSLFLVVPLLLAAIVWVWRVARKPRRRGVRYCRKCNYEIDETLNGGLPQCPECGCSLQPKNVVFGTRLLKRVAPAIVLAILAAGSAAVFIVPASGEPLIKWLAQRAGHSRFLYERLEQWKITPPQQALVLGSLLLEHDAATGKRLRTIAVLPSCTSVFALPDGRSLLFGHPLKLVRLRDGRITDKPFPVSSLLGASASSLLGHIDDGKTMVSWLGTRHYSVGEILTWSLKTGRIKVVSVPSYLDARPAALDERGNLVSVIGFPPQHRGGAHAALVAEMIDIQTGSRMVMDLGSRFLMNVVPLVARDGSRGYILEDDGSSVRVFDPATGNRIDTLDLSVGAADLSMQVLGEPLLLHDDRWLALFKPSSDVLIYDIDHRQWLGRLELSPQSETPQPNRMRTNNRRVLAVVDTARGRFQFGDSPTELLIWDLSSLQPTPTTPPAPSK